MSNWPFVGMEPGTFDVVMADPAWTFKTWSEKDLSRCPQGQYECMSLDAIKALPVADLAAPNCWLWLWGTYPLLHAALEVIPAWGFTYSTGGTWIKRGASGKLAIGMGKVLRGNAEPFLIARRGAPKVHSRGVRNVIEAPRREHSRKPDQAYAAAEALFGPGKRADLFARESRQGWQAWGREASKFDAEAA